jgi:hypothetical protein
MSEAFQFVAILSCTLFAGAALYINLAEHPARMQCGTELAATVLDRVTIVRQRCRCRSLLQQQYRRWVHGGLMVRYFGSLALC